MTRAELSGFDLLEQALKSEVPTSFRVSIPAQIASIVWAPFFSWVIWKGSGLHLATSWIFLVAVWALWYCYLLSPHKVKIEASQVSVHWWYRRVVVPRSAVSIEARPTAASRLFGYDLLVVGKVGKFPIWPDWFLVNEYEVREGSD